LFMTMSDSEKTLQERVAHLEKYVEKLRQSTGSPVAVLNSEQTFVNARLKVQLLQSEQRVVELERENACLHYQILHLVRSLEREQLVNACGGRSSSVAR